MISPISLRVGMSTPGARLVEDEQLGIRGEPLRHHDLLLVAAGQLPRRRARGRRLDLQALREALVDRPALAVVDQPAARQVAVEAGGACCSSTACIEHEPLQAAILGDQHDAGVDRVARGGRA